MWIYYYIFYCSIYYVKINLFWNIIKIFSFLFCCKVIVYLKNIRGQTYDYMLQGTFYDLQIIYLNLFTFAPRFEQCLKTTMFWIQKCFFFFVKISQSDNVLGPAHEDYTLVSKTRFNLEFAINICVVFGPCHKDNMVVVIKTNRYLYLNMLICR